MTLLPCPRDGGVVAILEQDVAPLQGAEGATDTRGSLRDRVPTVGAREVLLRRGASGLRVGELWPVRVLRRTVAGVLVLREATVGPQVRRHVGPRLSGLDRGRQR